MSVKLPRYHVCYSQQAYILHSDPVHKVRVALGFGNSYKYKICVTWSADKIPDFLPTD